MMPTGSSAQPSQRRVAGAEVVERQRDAGLADRLQQQAAARWPSSIQRRLGQLDDELAGVEAALMNAGDQPLSERRVRAAAGARR